MHETFRQQIHRRELRKTENWRKPYLDQTLNLVIKTIEFLVLQSLRGYNFDEEITITRRTRTTNCKKLTLCTTNRKKKNGSRNAAIMQDKAKNLFHH